MEREKKNTLICFDAFNWMSCYFWNNYADLQYCADPWEALRVSDRRVETFVSAAGNADFELVVVMAGAHDPDVSSTYKQWVENCIRREKRRTCLGADMFLAESFQNHGVRLVRPIGVDAVDVLASLAYSVEGAIIVSRNKRFPLYDKVLRVCTSFTVSGGKLVLESPVTRINAHFPLSRSGRWFRVQPHLARSHETCSLGLAPKYRPSLRNHGRVDLGDSSSSDRRMGNLYVIARPLRAAVYAILGEQLAPERIPQWSNDKRMVEWTEAEVVAESCLESVLKDPLSVVEWIVNHDTPVVELKPWRAAERHFNICSLAAELVAVSSDGKWTMHQCMELFSKKAEIVNRTCRGDETSARRRFATPTLQHQSSPPNLLPGTVPSSVEVMTNQNESSTSRPSRVSIFGTGRHREEVLKEREDQNIHQ